MTENADLRLATYVQICCLQGSLAGRLFAFIDPAPLPVPQPFWLGRGADCHLAFQGSSNGMVSRNHAEIHIGVDGVRFIDCSSHGSYLAQTQERIASLDIPFGSAAAIQLGRSGPICEIAVGIAVPFGVYSLVAKLGEGGMAEVYLARDNRLERFVVLKLLRPELRRVDPLAEQHLLNEARIVAQLEHNQVVRIYELGELGGIPYIAMEYLRGISLRQLNEQLARLGKLLPPALAAAILRQACLGLHAAHELPAKVVHRDISHNNILITPDSVKVIDFGIARTNSPGAGPTTEPDVTKGCPPYMSPEQICAPATVTRLSDIFSIAVVLYELCSGRSLFSRANHIATMAAVLTDEAPALREVCAQASARLEQLLAQALAKKADDRQPTTAAEFAALLKDEAGPHLLHHDNIVSALEQLGVQLQSSPPAPLEQEPELVRRARPVTLVPAPAVALLGPPPARPPAAFPVAPLASALDLLDGAQTHVLSDPDFQPDLPALDWLLSVDLPVTGGYFELRTSQVAQLCVTSQDLYPRDYREPIPLALALAGLVRDCRCPLVLALSNRLIELRVAAETVKAGRSFRIYPAELTTHGARNSYSLPLPCAGKALWVGHHRGEYCVLTVASSSAGVAESIPLSLELAELGVKLLAPAGTERLCAVYRVASPHRCSYLACFTIRRE